MQTQSVSACYILKYVFNSSCLSSEDSVKQVMANQTLLCALRLGEELWESGDISFFFLTLDFLSKFLSESKA